MPLTLDELLTAPTDDQLEQKLLAALNSAGFPVSDWNVGGVARSIVKMHRAGIKDLSDLVPAIVRGGFPTLSSGDWLTLLAREIFKVARVEATYTKQRCKMTCAAGTGPYDIVPSQTIARSPTTGHRYFSNESKTIPADGSEYVEFLAESPGASYVDPAGTITELVTPLPGLSITNPSTSFGAVDSAGAALKTGSSTGTATPQETVMGVAPSFARLYTLRVTIPGQVGAGEIGVYVDGILSTTLSPIPSTYDAGGGVTIAFANGAQSPSFLTDTSFTFVTPGSPITNQGADAEDDASVLKRCLDRWPSLSVIPTNGRYEGWIRQCSIENGYGVSKVTAAPSTVVAGQTNVYVAGSTGAPPGGVIAALQVFVDLRDGIVDLAAIIGAVNLSVAVGGTVIVRAAQYTAVRALAQANWDAYLAALLIGGDPPDGACRIAKLEQAIMDAGAVDVSGLTLNGNPLNVALTATQVAVASNTLASGLTWLTVP